MTYICVGKQTFNGSDNGLSPGHWNSNRNSNIFIQENAFDSAVCKKRQKTAILSRSQCVKAVFFLRGEISLMTNHPIHLSCVYTKKDVPFTYFLGDRIRYHHRQCGIIRYQENQHLSNAMGLLPDTQHCGLRTRRECRERFPRQCGLAIPTCITARASSTCRDACRVAN